MFGWRLALIVVLVGWYVTNAAEYVDLVGEVAAEVEPHCYAQLRLSERQVKRVGKFLKAQPRA